MHRYLLDGFDARNHADYDIVEEVTPELAQLQIEHADEFVRVAAEMLSGQQLLDFNEP